MRGGNNSVIITGDAEDIPKMLVYVIKQPRTSNCSENFKYILNPE